MHDWLNALNRAQFQPQLGQPVDNWQIVTRILTLPSSPLPHRRDNGTAKRSVNLRQSQTKLNLRTARTTLPLGGRPCWCCCCCYCCCRCCCCCYNHWPVGQFYSFWQHCKRINQYSSRPQCAESSAGQWRQLLNAGYECAVYDQMRASNTPIKQACSLDKSNSNEMRYVSRDLRCEKKLGNSVKGFVVELTLKGVALVGNIVKNIINMHYITYLWYTY